jgi:hypothetical protein
MTSKFPARVKDTKSIRFIGNQVTSVFFTNISCIQPDLIQVAGIRATNQNMYLLFFYHLYSNWQTF